MRICEECGNDDAAEGFRFCTDCMEMLTERGWLPDDYAVDENERPSGSISAA